jgi:exodeoxyribonuclease V alpha subunit
LEQRQVCIILFEMPEAGFSLQSLRGTIERVTFYNEENGYTVARFLPEGKAMVVTVVGSLMGASVGESLALEGIWTNHPQHGRQFEIKHFSLQLPATVEGLRKYLGSGLIKGVGPVTAERIVKHFGMDTLAVIERSIDRLKEVEGVGARRIALIQRGWAEQKQIKEVMLFLQSHGVSTSLAVKIYKEYGAALSPLVHLSSPRRSHSSHNSARSRAGSVISKRWTAVDSMTVPDLAIASAG